MKLRTFLKERWQWAVAGLTILLVGGGFAVAALMGAFSPAEEPVAAPAKPTAVVTPTPTPTPTPEPEVVVDIATTEFMPYTEVWNPPDMGENFWQVVDPENGYPEDGGTDFLLAHACESADQGCAGDAVRTLDTGDQLTYRGGQFIVQEKIDIPKEEIASQNIWVHDPNRIVIITCILDLETGTFDRNEIFIATPAT